MQCDASNWPVTWTASTGASHYIVRYICGFTNPSYQTANTTVDLCTEVGMCNNAMCANGCGPVTVEACAGSCCSAPVQVNINDTPIACGGGVCC